MSSKTIGHIFFAISVFLILAVFAIYAGFYVLTSSLIRQNVRQALIWGSLLDRQIALQQKK
ncbi:MAG: hypothetical protein AAB897_02875 [Patescibacteria group bacterium]